MSGPSSEPVVGIVMGSDSDWPVMEPAALALRGVRRPLRGARRLRPPHARAGCSTTPRRRPAAACG